MRVASAGRAVVRVGMAALPHTQTISLLALIPGEISRIAEAGILALAEGPPYAMMIWPPAPTLTELTYLPFDAAPAATAPPAPPGVGGADPVTEEVVGITPY